jgi:hypothetical protein
LDAAADTYAPTITIQLVDTIPPILYTTKKSVGLTDIGTLRRVDNSCEVVAAPTAGAVVTGEHCANTRVTEGGVSYASTRTATPPFRHLPCPSTTRHFIHLPQPLYVAFAPPSLQPVIPSSRNPHLPGAF